MESTPDELRFGQRTMEDPHGVTWEDGQWSKAGGDTWRSSGCNEVSGGGWNLRAGGVRPAASELGQRERRDRRSGRATLAPSNGETMHVLPFP